jgi:hypothetical protein
MRRLRRAISLRGSALGLVFVGLLLVLVILVIGKQLVDLLHVFLAVIIAPMAREVHGLDKAGTRGTAGHDEVAIEVSGER